MQEVTVLTITGRQEAFVGDYMEFRQYNITPMERVIGASPAEFVDVRTARPVRLLARGRERFYAVMDPEVAHVARACADVDLQDELKNRQAELADLRRRLALARADRGAFRDALDRMASTADQEKHRWETLPWWRRVWEALRA